MYVFILTKHFFNLLAPEIDCECGIWVVKQLNIAAKGKMMLNLLFNFKYVTYRYVFITSQPLFYYKKLKKHSHSIYIYWVYEVLFAIWYMI